MCLTRTRMHSLVFRRADAVSRIPDNLFDHLIRASHNGLRHGQTKLLGSLEIDHQLELSRTQNRQFSGIGSVEYLSC